MTDFIATLINGNQLPLLISAGLFGTSALAIALFIRESRDHRISV